MNNQMMFRPDRGDAGNAAWTIAGTRCAVDTVDVSLLA